MNMNVKGWIGGLILGMVAIGCGLPDLPAVEHPAQCFGKTSETCERIPNCDYVVTHVDYRGWPTDGTCAPEHTCRHVGTGDAMGTPHEAECPTGSVCLKDRVMSGSNRRPYCFPKAGQQGAVQPNQCGTSRVAGLRALPEEYMRLSTNEFIFGVYVGGFSENGVVLDELLWEIGTVEPLLEFAIPEEVTQAEECVEEDLIQENLHIRLSPQEEFRGATELRWNVRCGEEIFTVVEAANHRRPDELRYSEVVSGQAIETPRGVEFWQVPVEARWDESAGRIAVVNVDGGEERELLGLDGVELVPDSLQVATDLTKERYLLAWLTDGEEGVREVITTVISSSDQWESATANSPEILHSGAAVFHVQRMDQDFGVIVPNEAGDEVVSYRLHPDGRMRDTKSQPFSDFGQARLFVPVFDDILIISDAGIMTHVCAVAVD